MCSGPLCSFVHVTKYGKVLTRLLNVATPCTTKGRASTHVEISWQHFIILPPPLLPWRPRLIGHFEPSQESAVVERENWWLFVSVNNLWSGKNSNKFYIFFSLYFLHYISPKKKKIHPNNCLCGISRCTDLNLAQYSMYLLRKLGWSKLLTCANVWQIDILVNIICSS